VRMRSAVSITVISSLLLASCGGGGSESKIEDNSPTPVVNQAPVISNNFLIKDSSGNGVVEAAESFQILLNITDNENDTISGSITIDDVVVSIESNTDNSEYSHQANFVVETKGNKQAQVSVQDSKNNQSTSNIDFVINPSFVEVQQELSNVIDNFTVGGYFDQTELLGTAQNNDESTLGYVANNLSQENIAYNQSPFGVCGVNTPNKLVKVDVSLSNITIPEVGVVFPLECLNQSQSSVLKSKIQKSKSKSNHTNSLVVQSTKYLAHNFLVTRDENGDISISDSGEGITFQGTHEMTVSCGEFALKKVNGAYQLDKSIVLEKLESLFADSQDFELTCERNLEYGGEQYTSPLYATIKGSIRDVDNSFPDGLIKNVEFSIPYLNGALDEGDVCVETVAVDNGEVVSELLTIRSSNELLPPVQMSEEENGFCGSLKEFEGTTYVQQVLVDDFGNQTVVKSDSFYVERNDAPVFSSELPSKFAFSLNQGVVELVSKSDLTDPEGHEFSLSSETNFDTGKAAGNYSVSVIAKDKYDATSQKDFEITLADKLAPLTELKVIGSYLMSNGKYRDINQDITLSLIASDADGQVTSTTLHSYLDNETPEEVLNYTANYTHSVAAEGGHTRTFTYQATDNEGNLSEEAELTISIDQNEAPTYGGRTSFSLKRGGCVDVDKIATDPEGDDVTFVIEDESFEVCSTEAGEVSKELSIKDKYLAETIITINIDFTDCAANEIWSGQQCVLQGGSTPDPFVLTPSGGSYKLSEQVYSFPVTLTGLNSAATLIVSNGTVSVNGGEFSSDLVTVNNLDSIVVSHVGSSEYDTVTTTVVTIGSQQSTLESRTITAAPYVFAGDDITLKSFDIGNLWAKYRDYDGRIVSRRWELVSGSQALKLIEYPGTDGTTDWRTFEAPEVSSSEQFTYRLHVTDNDGNTAYDDVEITVLPTDNIPPTMNVGIDIDAEKGKSYQIRATANDPDGQIAKVKWIPFHSNNNNPLPLVLEDDDTLNPSFTAPDVTVKTRYGFRLDVQDNNGKWSNIKTNLFNVSPYAYRALIYIDVFPTATNQAPVSNAGADMTVTTDRFSNDVTLTSLSTDSDGSLVQYYWQNTDTSLLHYSSTPSLTLSIEEVSEETTVTFLHYVVDNEGKVSQNVNGGAADQNDSYMTITLKPPVAANQPPKANAGPDVNISPKDGPQYISIYGSGIDSDGSIEKYFWKEIPNQTGIYDDSISQLQLAIFPVTEPETLLFKLTVYDDKGKPSDEQEIDPSDQSDAFVRVFVTPYQNKKPVANAGADNLFYGSSTITLSGSGTDVDGTVAEYIWESDDPNIVLSDANTATPMFSVPDPDSKQVYKFSLTVVDDSGASSDSIDNGEGDASDSHVYITVFPASTTNQTPLAIAGPDLTVKGGESVQFQPAAYDPDGTIEKHFWWVLTDGGSVDSQVIESPTYTAPLVGKTEEFLFHYEVLDNRGAQDERFLPPGQPGDSQDSALFVYVEPNYSQNIPPVVNVGPDQTVNSGETVTITGVATDLDGTISEYTWSQNAGDTITLSSTDTATTSFVAPVVTETTVIKLLLNVKDDQGKADVLFNFYEPDQDDRFIVITVEP